MFLSITFLAGPESGCGGDVTVNRDAVEEISAFKVGEKSQYEPDTWCEWLVIGDRGRRLRLDFVQMDLQDRVGEECQDYLEVQTLSHDHK